MNDKKIKTFIKNLTVPLTIYNFSKLFEIPRKGSTQEKL